ncbi:hypothetical protein DEJ46_37715 [Streptomyces venezuelae]|uniref:Uncharacterized protein n=1 Tax=Streptomyces venezuelae TaxID=54571 RepID=A0A5P2B2G9_STRVZ|nr:hypothetical protein DEJ46_37715 [Streptomyces venezuelae]
MNVQRHILSGRARARGRRAVASAAVCGALLSAVAWGGVGSVSGSASATESPAPPHGLISDEDAEQIFGSPVDPQGQFSPDAVPELPGCPAYARVATEADQRIGYISDGGDQLMEVVVEDGDDTRLLEDLRECSGGTAGGNRITIDLTSAPGGPGNVTGAIGVDDTTVHLRARVVDGDNIEVFTVGTSEQADTAIDVAEARYAGTPLPEGHSD